MTSNQSTDTQKKRKRISPIDDIPIAVLSDSYKASHFLMYPKANKMVAYAEFRSSYENSKEDQRFIFYGIRYIIERYVCRRWTMDDINKAEIFYSTHNAGYKPFPFPKDLFIKVVKEHDGYFPIRIEALPEGTVAHAHTPVYQLTTKGEFSPLCTFLETILTQVWYPSTVATLSRLVKDIIEEGYEKSVDEDSWWTLESRLHDFGARGTSGVEASTLGGTAHLLNFIGSDTMSAAYFAQFELNNGKPVAQSIPATEHSVMTAWRSEKEAILNMIDKFGGSVFATVMDSYDYGKALDVVVPSVVEEKKKKGGLWILRPDSGDPVEAIMEALRAGEKNFGYTINKKGYKVLKGVATIQGDAVTKPTAKKILDAALAEGYSAQNIAFGMGGGLLQRVHRDNMSFATKLSYIEYADGTKRDIMKYPKGDPTKISLPGILRVKKGADGLEHVLPRAEDEKFEKDDLLRVVYDNGPIDDIWDDFDTIRNRIQEQWKKAPKLHDPISSELKTKISKWMEQHNEEMKTMYKNM